MMPFDAFEENSRGRRKGKRSGADCFEFVRNGKMFNIYNFLRKLLQIKV